MMQSREILASTTARPAFYGCYGYHEWAMLYSGGSGSQRLPKHQDTLSTRVDQNTIDSIVDGGVRCTHYDAFRFFHPNAKPLNVINPITKESQKAFEQPGCVHANMDLFKYAFHLYPLVDCAVLRDSLRLAIEARKIDMRASPYDVSSVPGCEDPICVETAEGRKRYAEEQERLAKAASVIRSRLLDAYNIALEGIESAIR
jgi:hypothetical protein